VNFKIGAYAGGGTKPYIPTAKGTWLYTKSTEDGGWTFYDEFAGDACFSGWEYLVSSKDPAKNVGVWSMVYRGSVLDHEIGYHKIF